MNAPISMIATGILFPVGRKTVKHIFLAFNFIMLSFIACPGKMNAQTLPAGFSQVLVTNGITNPTTMAFAPDGRIFVAQQEGQLRVVKNGTLLTQPFLSVSVNSSGERGLLGVAFDPAFATNKYIYIFYTLSSGARNRISRFTANGDVAVAGSEVIILDLDPLSSATNHNGGNMQFGPDGKLYVGTGENANTDWAQDLDSYHGKILRINADGSVPAGNPYTTGSSQKLRVWSYGLRNPFTLSIQPGTGRLFVNDVGQVDWEEINEASSGGKNFGWAWTEGNTTNPLYTSPIYTYQHREAGSGSGCAITGGTFFNPSSTNYPAAYMGKYFYMDYCGNWINMLTLSGTTATSTTFASNIAGSPVAILTGTDGNLYFLSRNNNALYKITYSGSSAPVITTQPQSLSVAQGNTATFSVTVTGSSPLSYQWKKSGTNITGATNSTYSIASTVSSNAGTYSVTITNAAGTITSSNATLTVTSPNLPPTASITSPAAGYSYAGGELINYAGTGTDPENGILAASAFKWYVLFYHDTHNHPGPTAVSGVKNGSFTIPTNGETASNVWYRLFLVVTDSQGATDTAFTDILPRTSLITINSSPQGLAITLDGQPFTTPITVTSVEGITRSVSATSPQTLNGNSHNFVNWTQGGSQTQSFATAVNDMVYTANYSVATNTPYGGTARIIPGTIQVEDFDNGGQNLAYYDSSPENSGGAYRLNESIDLENSTEAGFNIGWTNPGEWAKYTVNVSTTGVYTLGARVSSQNNTSSFRVEMDGVIISTIPVPLTGGFQSWQTVSKPEIYLTAGIKVMKIYFITGGFNLNYLTFTATTVSNYPPVAIAGPDQVISLPVSTVNLSGSGTDSDGTIDSYSWKKISGNTATISNPTDAFITVTNLTAGIYKFELTVTDNNGATGRDTVQVTVNAASNISPNANAGPDQTISLPTASVNLSGSGTDPDGTVSSILWSKISGPSSFFITNPLGAITSVNSLVAGIYQFEFKITDNNGAIGKDTVQVTMKAASNISPNANAGPDQTISLPTASVNLSGSGTDPDGTVSSILWSKISGPSSFFITNPLGAITSVNSLVAGIYQFEFKITDNNGALGKDTMQVTVKAASNISPNANAGPDQTISLPTASVNLSGSGTDPDGTVSSILWSKISGPSSFFISNPLGAITSVNSLVAGIYQFEFKITDNNGAIGKDTMQVTVKAASNISPNANAGPDQAISLPTASVNLSGSGTDPDGTVSSFLWSKVEGPAGFIISNPLGASTLVNSLVAGVYKFEFRVTDNNGATGRDTMQVTVIAAATVPLAVQVNIYENNVYNNVQWNNWKPVKNIASSNFLYTNGTQSSMNATLSKQTSIIDNGTSYAQSATACPPPVLQYYSSSNSARNLVINGMNPAKFYTFKFYAGSTITPNGTTYFIKGFGSDDIITDNNINNIGKIVNVKPNSSGVVTVNLLSIYTHNFIAGFSITEQSATISDELKMANTDKEQLIEPENNSVVYPNPFTGNLQIKLNSREAGTYLLKLIDAKGNIVRFKPVIKNDQPTVEVINTSRFAQGIYYLEISGPGEKKSVHKLIKK